MRTAYKALRCLGTSNVSIPFTTRHLTRSLSSYRAVGSHDKGSLHVAKTVTVTDDAISDLANKPQHSLSLADLVK
jgi:hypothetical protein